VAFGHVCNRKASLDAGCEPVDQEFLSGPENCVVDFAG